MDRIRGSLSKFVDANMKDLDRLKKRSGPNRSRTKSGRWRKKRSDAGVPRKRYHTNNPKSVPTFDMVKKIFEEHGDPRFPMFSLKDLYQHLRKECRSLSIKEFHQFILGLWKPWSDRKVDLAKGSSILFHVRRYGLYTDGFYWAYIHLRRNDDESI